MRSYSRKHDRVRLSIFYLYCLSEIDAQIAISNAQQSGIALRRRYDATLPLYHLRVRDERELSYHPPATNRVRGPYTGSEVSFNELLECCLLPLPMRE